MPPATAPKKPLTAFFCFRRALAKAELSGAGVAAVAKLTGERWKALTPEERQVRVHLRFRCVVDDTSSRTSTL